MKISKDKLKLHIGRRVLIGKASANNSAGIVVGQDKTSGLWLVAMTDWITDRNFKDAVWCEGSDLIAIGFFSEAEINKFQDSLTLNEYLEKVNK